MGYQSIFYDISNQLQHCLWLLPPMSDGCRQPDLGGAGVLTGRRMSCTSNSRADVLQNQAVHWEDVACKEESLEFWGWNEAVPKADLGVRLECRQSLKYQWCQGWALWTWQTSLYSPVSLRDESSCGNHSVPHSGTCGRAWVTGKEGDVFLEFPAGCSLPSPLCIAGLQTRSSSKPSAAFSLLFPPPASLSSFPLLGVF